MPESRTVKPEPVGTALGQARRRSTSTPPADVNLTALPTRLRRTWARRRPSPWRAPGTSGATVSVRRRPLAAARSAIIERRCSMTSPEGEVAGLQGQLAGLDLGQVEDVVDDLQQVLRRSRRSCPGARPGARSAGSVRSRWVRPMIAFIGVRISWLMLARKVLLARFAASAASLACASAISARRRIAIRYRSVPMRPQLVGVAPRRTGSSLLPTPSSIRTCAALDHGHARGGG